MNYMRIIILFLFSVVLSISYGKDTNVMSENLTRKAEEILHSSEVFTQKVLGVARVPSENSWALSIILKYSNNPSQVFQRLASSGRKYALVYSIVGAHRSDKVLYQELKDEVTDEEFRFWYKVGDLTLSVKINDIFDMLENDGMFDDFVFSEIPDYFDTVRPILEDSLRAAETLPDE